MIKTIVLVAKSFDQVIQDMMVVPLYDQFSDAIKHVQVKRDLDEESKDMPEVIQELEKEEEEFDAQEREPQVSNIFGVSSSPPLPDMQSGSSLDLDDPSNLDKHHKHATKNQAQNFRMIGGARVIITPQTKEFIKSWDRLNRFDIQNLELLIFYGGTDLIGIDPEQILIDYFNLQTKVKTFKKLLKVDKDIKQQMQSSAQSNQPITRSSQTRGSTSPSTQSGANDPSNQTASPQRPQAQPITQRVCVDITLIESQGRPSRRILFC